VIPFGTEIVLGRNVFGWPLIWLSLCQAGNKIVSGFFHGSSSDLAQWTVELAPAA
jgi:hypothetical protein